MGNWIQMRILATESLPSGKGILEVPCSNWPATATADTLPHLLNYRSKWPLHLHLLTGVGFGLGACRLGTWTNQWATSEPSTTASWSTAEVQFLCEGIFQFVTILDSYQQRRNLCWFSQIHAGFCLLWPDVKIDIYRVTPPSRCVGLLQ